ncbi:MAG TPA: exosortase/archaeosortase family protein [Methylomirabilota bacterium]|nr:exosortase/archaeosortase family protein [Methylomirabilota bacterium]
MNRRFAGWCIYLVILCGAFALPLREFITYARQSEVHSYVLLIPFVTAYLIYIRWKQLSRELSTAWGNALLFALAGTAALSASLYFTELGQNDYTTLIALSFVCLVIAGTFLFLGSKWARSAMFPLFFLAFMIPLPEAAVDFLENASKEASAEVANWLFLISGTPALRIGTVFQLPGISIMVAKECSGIRSSLVLVITSLLAANMFLRTTWRRALLVGAVIPLGLLRNGFRILVISLLCVHIGPEMINSPIHRRGGPIFFVASLIPLFVVLWWLRRGEMAAQQPRTSENPKSIPADVPIV